MSYKISKDCIGCGACARKCPAKAVSGELKKRFSIDPLLCTDCGTCFKTCPRGAVIDPQGNRSALKVKSKKNSLQCRIDPDVCGGCRACYMNCPQKAIRIVKRGLFRGNYCKVDSEQCVGCALCSRYCITGAIEVD